MTTTEEEKFEYEIDCGDLQNIREELGIVENLAALLSRLNYYLDTGIANLEGTSIEVLYGIEDRLRNGLHLSLVHEVERLQKRVSKELERRP